MLQELGRGESRRFPSSSFSGIYPGKAEAVRTGSGFYKFECCA